MLELLKKTSQTTRLPHDFKINEKYNLKGRCFFISILIGSHYFKNPSCRYIEYLFYKVKINWTHKLSSVNEWQAINSLINFTDHQTEGILTNLLCCKIFLVIDN